MRVGHCVVICCCFGALVAPSWLGAEPAGTGGPLTSTITGQVRSRAGEPLPGATVRLVDLGRTTLTDSAGGFTLAFVPNGTYTLSFRIIGYAPEVRHVTVAGAPVTLDVTLNPSAVELAALQVTASAYATGTFESPQPTTVVGAESLREAQAPSLGETLEGTAGVRSQSVGVGIGKPVIRGLTSNRVLVLDNGQRLETQQWGDEHGPQIEAAMADRIEVIRGPASVLYGSDALGGVINVIPTELPDAIGRSSFARGRLSGGYATGNRQPDGTLSLEGGAGGLGFRASATGRTSENVRTPTYELWNSGNRSVTGSGQLGYRGVWGSVAGRYTYRHERIELTDEDPAATPFQRIADHRARVDLALPLRKSRIEATFGFERNRRREFEDAAATDVALGLTSTTYTGDLHVHHPVVGPFLGIAGLSAQHTGFGKFGEETLIPNTRVANVGVYAFEQTQRGRWDLSLGARYEYRRLTVDDDADIGVTAQTRHWHSVTGNLGVLYRVARPVAVVLNVGRGFRAPSSFDLFSNGVHEGTIAFERGDPNLRNEKSLNADLALRVLGSNVVAELGGFVNAIQDYIFTIPTTETDPESGFEIFDVAQGNALLAGFELSLDYHVTSFLHLHTTGDYVRGQNTSLDQPLPAMPPLRATYALRLEGQAGPLPDAYLSISGETNARQTRLGSAEAAFFAQAFDGAGYRSTGYSLANLGAGFALPTPGWRMRLDFQLRNALNTTYANFLSRIKTNAPDPGQGRSLVVRVTADF
jgi:iron complex outermembrane receptor protein